MRYVMIEQEFTKIKKCTLITTCTRKTCLSHLASIWLITSGELHPKPKFAYFVYYFKIVNTALENNIKTCMILFWSITQEPLGLL